VSNCEGSFGCGIIFTAELFENGVWLEMMKKSKFYQIAVDGPAGAGKSTVARKVAESLGFCYLDTGAMYRVIAYKALQVGIALDNEEEITKLAQQTEISFGFDQSDPSVYCDGQDVTLNIRDAEVSRAVAAVASYPGVRERLVTLQRLEATKGSVVMDGRDIGTYVLPQAAVKIFLTASEEERAKRRYIQEINMGKDSSFVRVLEDMKLRDQLDSEREYAPLRPASDAIILDTTGKTIIEVVGEIVQIVQEVSV